MFGRTKTRPATPVKLRNYSRAKEKLTAELLLLEAEVKSALGPRREILQTEIEGRKNAIKAYTIAETLDYEEAKPPIGWFCGMMEDGGSSLELDEAAKKAGLKINDDMVDNLLFIAYTPPHIIERYKKATGIFGQENILVASPSKAVFAKWQKVVDPILFGYLFTVNKWFRIAQWDIAEDLKALQDSISDG